jgi:predicted metalloprotease with PDZ domain
VRRARAVCAALAAAAVTIVVAVPGASWAQAPPIRYRVTIPEPEHHWLQVEVTFPALGEPPLRARMSRSSPGRYAVHEFAKNVFRVDAFDAAGRPLPITRPDVDEWRVANHGGSVRLVYRIFGDRADGTYLAIDPTHAHLNMPATFMWGVGLEDRPIEIAFVPPPDSGWSVGTQLYPAADPFTFTAPNLQYFMDSPTELARLTTSTFTVPDGPRTARFRVMVHAEAAQADVDALSGLVERLVREQRAVFGAFPVFEPGSYTFLLDYSSWVDGDAMEHRNSTFITDPSVSLRTPAGRESAIDTISHEFFHVWNVERIRPAGLEPFDFTRSNITCCLWLAEGFTQYYGPLLARRAGQARTIPFGPVTAALTLPGRLVRSPVEMSEHGPFADAAVAIDTDDRDRTFISYYISGAAVAMGLDLELRGRTNGRVSLDDFMRRLFERFGEPAGALRPGYVARPYTLADLRRELGELTGDAAFAAAFFDRHIEGREPIDFARLLARAGYILGPAAPSRGWIGDVAVLERPGGLLVGGDGSLGGPNLVPFGSPLAAAGIDRGDTIVAIDDRPASTATWRAITTRTPGTTVRLTFERRDGGRRTVSVTVAADPALQIVPAESRGELGAAERAFREHWFASRAN